MTTRRRSGLQTSVPDFSRCLEPVNLRRGQTGCDVGQRTTSVSQTSGTPDVGFTRANDGGVLRRWRVWRYGADTGRARGAAWARSLPSGTFVPSPVADRRPSGLLSSCLRTCRGTSGGRWMWLQVRIDLIRGVEAQRYGVHVAAALMRPGRSAPVALGAPPQRTSRHVSTQHRPSEQESQGC